MNLLNKKFKLSKYKCIVVKLTTSLFILFISTERTSCVHHQHIKQAEKKPPNAYMHFVWYLQFLHDDFFAISNSVAEFCAFHSKCCIFYGNVILFSHFVESKKKTTTESIARRGHWMNWNAIARYAMEIEMIAACVKWGWTCEPNQFI